jgi:hypothetical protein
MKISKFGEFFQGKKGIKRYYQTEIRVQMWQKVFQRIFQNLVGFSRGKRDYKILPN